MQVKQDPAYRRWLSAVSPQVVILAVAALAILAFLRLANEMAEGETRAFDRAVLLMFRNPADLAVPAGPPWVKLAMLDLTALGGTAVLTIIAFGSIGFLAAQRRWSRALFLAGAIGGGALLNTVLKIGFARPRPDIVAHLVDVTSQSFPSGHAMNSAVVYLTLGALGSRATKGAAAKAYLVAAAIVLTLIVGFTRVYLGVHWPTDVLAGWAAGAAWATMCWMTAEYLRRRLHKPV